MKYASVGGIEIHGSIKASVMKGESNNGGTLVFSMYTTKTMQSASARLRDYSAPAASVPAPATLDKRLLALQRGVQALGEALGDGKCGHAALLNQHAYLCRRRDEGGQRGPGGLSSQRSLICRKERQRV